MARWTHIEEWSSLVSGRGCPICAEGGPSNLLAVLRNCWLTMGADAAPALPGTCALFLRRHVVELHELTSDEANQFMTAVQHVSRLLSEESGAVKINYEVHGNTIPHLHMHFFPRYRGDPFETGPIDPRVQGTALDLEKHLAIRQRLLARIAQGI